MDPAGMCLACALNCHEDHDIVPMLTRRNFRCDCGNSKFGPRKCQLIPDKDRENSMNVYNDNFHGVVCTCKKSLAGTTASTGNLTEVASGTAANAGADEDIVQCRICEEQYHASHIGVTEEDFGEEWAGEMVCRNCLNEHDFLRYYQADLNNPEAFIPEAGQICTLAALKRKFGEQQSAGRSYVFSGSWWGNLCRCSDCQVGHFVGCLSLCTQMSDLFVLFSAGHVQETECGLPSRSRGYFRLVRGTRGYKGDGKCPACSCNVSRRNLCADLRRF
ncbi:hypothetical protein RvY_00552-3 [Ramazzottius varieornatus]|uniref:UBR-type domain-containing protein n=1 Tax=Ramazzottius varieornatus TaxID=947166 RepID=A0A1D1UNK5_RAMVA|nr:hypothetical protein RvY_00552-3 [Ramazzottius varieornatus]